jgi:hypothetical protein
MKSRNAEIKKEIEELDEQIKYAARNHRPRLVERRLKLVKQLRESTLH